MLTGSDFGLGAGDNPIAVIDVAIRGGGIVLLLLYVVLFFRYRNDVAARYGIALAISAIIYLVHESFALDQLALPVRLALIWGANATIPLFWMFAAAWFDDEFRPRRVMLAMFVVFFALLSVRLDLPSGSAVDVVTSLAIDLLASIMAVMALWIVWRDRNADLVEPRRQIRRAFTLIIASFIIFALWGEAFHTVFGGYAVWRTVNAGALVGAVFSSAVLLFGLRSATIIGAASGPGQPPRRAQIDEQLAQKLNVLMSHDRLYRQERLTIGDLAARMGEREYRLREHINGGLGYRNFNDYLNQVRIREVCDALANPSQRDVAIQIIALDAGFGSLPAFHRVFKAAVGSTPGHFRVKALQNLDQPAKLAL